MTEGAEFFGGNLLVQPIFEWNQLMPGYNWRTFHPVQWEIEDDRMLGAVETTIVLLGLGVRVRWTYTETKFLRDMRAEVSRVQEEMNRKENGNE